jgi:hypothetical protein
VQHHHNIRPGAQGHGVTGLLIATVSVITAMEHVVDAQLARNFARRIRAPVVDDDYVIDKLAIYIFDGSLKRSSRIIGRKNHANSGTIDHD